MTSGPIADYGVVLFQEGARFRVDCAGREVSCVLRGRLRAGAGRVTSPVVVGDRVALTPLPDGTGAIESVCPRRSVLERPGYRGLRHVVAANVDRLVAVLSTREPEFRRHLAERFLAAAARGNMDAVVVVNKCDLEAEAVIGARIAPLEASGVPVVLTCVNDGRGLQALRSLLTGRISVLAGKSGVGKSSLLNALCPGLESRVRAVSSAVHKGRHTTTASRLYPLPFGGYLVDTPGIRALGLFEDAESLTEVFPEIREAAGRCRFGDCTHDHERDCAVKTAVARGRIHPDRYAHFLRLARGD